MKIDEVYTCAETNRADVCQQCAYRLNQFQYILVMLTGLMTYVEERHDRVSYTSERLGSQATHRDANVEHPPMCNWNKFRMAFDAISTTE